LCCHCSGQVDEERFSPAGGTSDVDSGGPMRLWGASLLGEKLFSISRYSKVGGKRRPCAGR